MTVFIVPAIWGEVKADGEQRPGVQAAFVGQARLIAT